MKGNRAKRPGASQRTVARRSSLTHLGEILQGALGRMSYLPSVARNRIWDEWEAIAGPTLSKMAHPERLHGTTLYVAVADSSSMQHLVLARDKLLKVIQERLGPQTITKLHFSLGKVSPDRQG